MVARAVCAPYVERAAGGAGPSQTGLFQEPASPRKD